MAESNKNKQQTALGDVAARQLAILVDDAIAVLEDVEIGKYHEYKYQ